LFSKLPFDSLSKMAFAAHQGFMPGGNDLHSGRMTLVEAKQWSADHPECLGFTFAGPPGTPPDNAPLDVYFKTSDEWAPGDGWHSFTKQAAAMMAAHAGFMPGGNDLHSGRSVVITLSLANF
jgi:hypothetical protein